ncbi:MAG: adenylate/guanylate cyclase domain-containing protein [Candidatus Wallbacteria bacterium]|nr:adenylate/guanylate cyclase domain-containing protein [Candidatus Wallbacteria bacterium]
MNLFCAPLFLPPLIDYLLPAALSLLILTTGLALYFFWETSSKISALRSLKMVEGQQQEKLNSEFREKNVRSASIMMSIKDIASTIDKDALFSGIVSLLEKGLGAERAAVFLIDRKTSEGFVVKCSKSINPTLKFSLKEESLLSRSAREGLYISRSEAIENPALKNLVGKGKVPTVACAPLLKGKEIVGVINVESLSGGRDKVTTEEKQLLAMICNVSSLAMNNANVFELTKDELQSEKKFSQSQIAEKKKVRDILSKYTSPTVVEEIMKNPKMLKLGGERKVATVFFSDIVNFTTYSEKYEPELVVQILNEYLTAMTDIILEHQGTLDKFVGDEIMALWGIPSQIQNHAELAIMACAKMLVKLRELQESWKQRNIEPFNIGMGLNTGELISGNMGSEKRMDFTVIGDTVNTAARLQSLTREYKCFLLISNSTYELVKHLVAASDIGEVQVKGKNKSIKVWRVDQIRG